MYSFDSTKNHCLYLEKIIYDLELEKSIKCFSNSKGENNTNYSLQEKEKKEEICLRINYDIWSNTLNYNKACK